MAEENPEPQEFKPDRKRKGPKSKAAKKKVRKNLTFNLCKLEGTKQIRFDEIVSMKVGKRQSSRMVPLRGCLSTNSAFYKKASTKTKDETKQFKQTYDTAATKKNTTCM